MSESAQLNKQLQDAQALVARRDLALKLGENFEFRKLILEDFMVYDAARLIAESGDPALDEHKRADALAMGQAGGHLKRYLSAMVQMGNTAERQIPQIREAMEEVRVEEDAA